MTQPETQSCFWNCVFHASSSMSLFRGQSWSPLCASSTQIKVCVRFVCRKAEKCAQVLHCERADVVKRFPENDACSLMFQ